MFTKIREQLDRIGHKREEEVFLSDVEFDIDQTTQEPILKIGGRQYTFSEVGMQTLANALGIPYGYLKKIKTPLCIANLDGQAQEETTLKFQFRGTELAAVVKTNYDTMPLKHQLDLLQGYFPVGGEVVDYVIISEKLYFVLLYNESKVDGCYPGFLVSMSDIGGKFTLTPCNYPGDVYPYIMQMEELLPLGVSYARINYAELEPQILARMTILVDKEMQQFVVNQMRLTNDDTEAWLNALAMSPISKTVLLGCRTYEKVTRQTIFTEIFNSEQSVDKLYDMTHMLARRLATDEFFDLWTRKQ